MACHTVTCRNIQHSSALLLWRQAPYSAPSAPHSGRGLAAGTRWSWGGWESLEIDVQHVVVLERTFLILFLSDERRDSLSPRSREGLSSTGLTSGDSSETRRPRLPGPSLCRPAHSGTLSPAGAGQGSCAVWAGSSSIWHTAGLSPARAAQCPEDFWPQLFLTPVDTEGSYLKKNLKAFDICSLKSDMNSSSRVAASSWFIRGTKLASVITR